MDAERKDENAELGKVASGENAIARVLDGDRKKKYGRFVFHSITASGALRGPQSSS